jgi:hypothetical protein
MLCMTLWRIAGPSVSSAGEIAMELPGNIVDVLLIEQTGILFRAARGAYAAISSCDANQHRESAPANAA